jgi:hypothetical protein
LNSSHTWNGSAQVMPLFPQKWNLAIFVVALFGSTFLGAGAAADEMPWLATRANGAAIRMAERLTPSASRLMSSFQTAVKATFCGVMLDARRGSLGYASMH